VVPGCIYTSARRGIYEHDVRRQSASSLLYRVGFEMRLNRKGKKCACGMDAEKRTMTHEHEKVGQVLKVDGMDEMVSGCTELMCVRWEGVLNV
jgi:hypothetical protein